MGGYKLVENGVVGRYTPERVERIVQVCRRQYGDSEVQIARRIGINRSTMNRIRRGLVVPSPRTIHALAKLEQTLQFSIQAQEEVNGRTVRYLINAVKRQLPFFTPTQRRRLKGML